jgi:DNA-binding MarR family transcriptional regulator
MTKASPGPAETAVTALILEVFRFNGRLLTVGDRLVADLGLTSARWQVIGAIALSPSSETVARLARTMGLARQSVQRIVNELADDDIVRFEDNPHHRRAKLVTLTKRGRALYDAADALQRPWAHALAQGLRIADIEAATRVVETLRRRLEQQSAAEDD